LAYCFFFNNNSTTDFDQLRKTVSEVKLISFIIWVKEIIPHPPHLPAILQG